MNPGVSSTRDSPGVLALSLFLTLVSFHGVTFSRCRYGVTRIMELKH